MVKAFDVKSASRVRMSRICKKVKSINPNFCATAVTKTKSKATDHLGDMQQQQQPVPGGASKDAIDNTNTTQPTERVIYRRGVIYE